MLDLILLPRDTDAALDDIYRRALQESVELYILSAYLTKWARETRLSSGCKTFRFIIGRDYGITRKQACEAVLDWIPPSKKHCFKVAARINGFHPKAMFWREKAGRMYALVGSSNLTEAAFLTNHEANAYQRLDLTQFEQVRQWIKAIERDCTSVGGDWLEDYKEAKLRGGNAHTRKSDADVFLERLQLPRPRGTASILKRRREQMKNFSKYRSGLMKLFRDCTEGRISNSNFYSSLSRYWSEPLDDRFQGPGWERQGKSANFKQLGKALLRIIDAAPDERDDVVTWELDQLREQRNSARGAFFSEMLCHWFPELYPVLDKPVKRFLEATQFKGPRGASEGAAYVNLAQRLRLTLRASKKHPAKNLAELDAVIWLKYH